MTHTIYVRWLRTRIAEWFAPLFGIESVYAACKMSAPVSLQPMQALLAARLDELRLIERIAPAAGERLLGDRLASELAATEALARPSMPEDFPEAKTRAYRRPTELVRMNRLCTIVEDGDRVVDIGVGGGYVLATLFENRKLEKLYGVDITDGLLQQAATVVAHNGLEDRVALELLDVTRMPEDWLKGKAADLVLMFEVLEHVSNPSAALGRLADAMSDELLIFSVPIQGRIEACWGHRHAFDVDAVMALISEAGLTLQYAEALYNNWAIFAVSKTSEPHSRIGQIAAKDVYVGPGLHVTMSPVRAARVVTNGQSEPLPSALNLQVELDGRSSYLEFDAPNLALFRIEVQLESVEAVSQVWFEAINQIGETVCRWDVEDIAFLGVKRSYPFRPGWPNRICRSTVEGPLRRISQVQMHVRSTSSTPINVPRVAYGQFSGKQLEPLHT